MAFVFVVDFTCILCYNTLTRRLMIMFVLLCLVLLPIVVLIELLKLTK